jgi:Protein of unknown function (DUF664)
VVHPLVEQVRFARSELVRGLDGVTDEEARKRFGSMNCISWIVGHLADQEQRYWLQLAQGEIIVPELNEQVGYGKPASTPPLDEMWIDWRRITKASDPYLDALKIPDLQSHYVYNGERRGESVGTLLLRVMGHYWFHLGEALAIRQMLGHTDLPQFVGDIGANAPFRPATE